MSNLDPSRVKEMFWLFSHVLPIYNSTAQKNCEKLLGADFTKLIPELAITIGNIAKNNPEVFDLYLDFIIQATRYMRLETNDQPDIDSNQDELQKAMKKSIEEFNKNAKSADL